MNYKKFFLTAVFLFSLSFLSAQNVRAVYLTWQKDPTTTMTVQWITDRGITDRENSEEESGEPKSAPLQKEVLQSKSLHENLVEFQKIEPDNSTWKTKEGTCHALPQDAPYDVHVVELTQLEPHTSYHFRLPGSEKIYLFRTLPQELNEPVVFVAGGDTHQCTTEMFAETNLKASQCEPYFALFGGDLAYASPRNRAQKEDSKRWIKWICCYSETMQTPSGYLIPLFVTLGNHDVIGHYNGTHDDAPFFYSLFATPGLPGYKAIHVSDYLSLYLLDSNHTNRIKGEQSLWLRAELAGRQKPTHSFACYHVPAYPSVRDAKQYESSQIRTYWCPLFEEFGINIVFENNDHAFKRTFPLKEGKVDPTGVVYIGDGSWGVKPRAPKKAKDTDYLAKTRQARQFLKVKLSKDAREVWSITPNGDVIDHYVQFVKE
jgi:acid phosphatase type 7